MKKLLLLLLLFVSAHMARAQQTNTNLSNGILFDGEPYLAVNPVNKRNFVAAWMGLKLTNGAYRIAIKTRASFDGGNTWSAVNTMPHFGNGFGSADPSMAFDKNGMLYLAYIDYKQMPDSGGIYVARSSNGGLLWDTPSKAFDMYDVPNKRPIDRPWLVVDKSNASNAGTLYITTKPAPWITPPNRNYFKVSTDKGFTWSTIDNVDGGSHLVGNVIAAPMAAPATTANGTFCAVYPSYLASQNLLPAYYLASSTDQGQTFSYNTVYAAVPVANDANFKNGYQLITHPVQSDKMFFVTPDASSGDADIVAFHSNNSGQNWSGPVRVNDDVAGNGKGQDMVWASYNEQGNIVVTWRDRRNAAANGFWNAGYDFFYATSTDNGQTFSANQKLSSQFIAFDSLVAESGNDFMGCVYQADTLYSVWGDTRNNRMNIYFVKTIVSTNTNVGVVMLEGDALQWALYPNPTSGEINLDLSDTMIGAALQIFNAAGKKVQDQKVDHATLKLNLEKLEPGVYFLQIDNSVKRFVKE
jgi:hypothetical protein